MDSRRRTLIMATVGDLAKILLDGSEDDELLDDGDVEAAIEAGEITPAEIVEAFRVALDEELGG